MQPDAFLPPEPAPRTLDDVRFYVDEDVLGLGLSLAWARRDLIACGVGPLAVEIPRGTPDPSWIPAVAGRGWIAITANSRIRTHPDEGPLAERHGLRAVCLADPRGRMTTWDRLTVLTRHFRAVENQIELFPTGPWWITVSASGVAARPYRGA